MRTVCITFAQGCPRSMMDAGKFVNYFKENGWKITTNIQEADMVLVGTCGFTLNYENKSIKFLSIANRKKRKSAKLVAFGCLPGINETRLLKKFEITTVTRSTLDRLDTIIDAEAQIRQIQDANDLSKYTDYITKSFSSFDRFLIENEIEFSRKFLLRVLSKIKSGEIFAPIRALYHRAFGEQKVYEKYRVYDNCTIFNVRVAVGCNESCTYCAIRFAAGPLTSKPLNKISKEFNSGLSKGYKLFRLVAEDVGAYGQDIGTNIVELLREIFNNKHHFQLIFDDFHPKWLVHYFPELLKIFTENRSRIGYIGLPIQSGSEKILQLMKRESTAEDSKKCILALQKEVPDLCITTHVVIGFPGEKEDDFIDTMKYLEAIRFKNVDLYKYSDRPNTDASKLPEKVPEEIKKSRMLRMEQFINQAS